MILMNHCIQSGFSLSTIKELICCSFSITYTEELKDIIITGDFTATKLTICLTMNTYRLLFLVSANALCLEYFVLLFFSFFKILQTKFWACILSFIKVTNIIIFHLSVLLQCVNNIRWKHTLFRWDAYFWQTRAYKKE